MYPNIVSHILQSKDYTCITRITKRHPWIIFKNKKDNITEYSLGNCFNVNAQFHLYNHDASMPIENDADMLMGLG